MKPLRLSLLLLAALATLPPRAMALNPTSWTDTAHDSSWNNPANWSNGVPNALSAATIFTPPSGNIIGVDTGLALNPLGALTLPTTLTHAITITGNGVEHLSISSGIFNLSSLTHELALPVEFASAQSVNTGGGLLFSSGVTLDQTVTISGSGLFTLASDTPAIFEIGATSFGRLAGTGTLTYAGSNFVFDLTSTVTVGNSWDVVDGTISGASPGSITLAGALYQGTLTPTSAGVWQGTAGGNTFEYREATGTLAVVPEPGTAALLGVGVLLLTRRRRPRRAFSSAVLPVIGRHPPCASS